MKALASGWKWLSMIPVGACLAAACAGEIDDPDKYKQSASGSGTNTGGSSTDSSGNTSSASAGTASTTTAGGTAATGSTATTTGGTAYTPPDCIVQYIQTDCAISGCHTDTQWGIKMSNLAADALGWVGHAAVANAMCAEKWIDPANYQNSLLWDKVANPMPATNCGAYMPFGATTRWDQAHLDCMTQFLQGAIAAKAGM